MKYKKDTPYLHKGLALRVELAEIRGGFCERCGWANFAGLQVHHKIQRCDGGTDEHENLELLCSNCHTEHHLGYLTFEDWKSKPK